MKPDLLHLSRHLLQVLAFSLVISSLLYFFSPERPYELPLVYSLCIGVCTWAWIDLGRFLVGIDPRTGWPDSWRGIALVGSGIAGGYVAGTLLGDHWFGWSSWSSQGWVAQRSSLITSGLAGVVISSYFYLQGKSQVLQERVQQVQAEATEAQLRLLLTQLEPHMLFNTLANLRVLVGLDPERAQQMLDHLIAYLRATLSASRAVEHPLQAEFDRLADYLELMAVRMGPRLSFQFDLPPELRQASVPPLLLQPLVENSIRHGLEPQVAGGHIAVSARQEGPPGTVRLVLTVADTGVGLQAASPAAEREQERGFGLTQVRERLRTLYGPACGLELRHAQPQGTLAVIHLPLKTLSTPETAAHV